MANRFSPAPSHGGAFRSGEPHLIVIHSLEAPARRGLAWDLANGWIKNAGVSPHSMTDPGETVDLLDLGTVGWHCGNGNQYSIGLEVTGYAAWSTEQWTTGDAFEALKLDAKRAAEVAKAKGIPMRWLSLAEIRAGARGFCTHADISATYAGTNHTDPGRGFPYALFMQLVLQFAGLAGVPSTNPNPQPGGGPGGADPKDEDEDMALNVVRCESIDYAWSATTGVFYTIRDKDHYNWLLNTGIIKTPHGDAPSKSKEEREFIRAECARAAGRHPEYQRVEGYGGN